MTNTTAAAEIICTKVEGQIHIFVNGESLGTVADGRTLVQRIEKVLRAAHVFRSTGYVAEAGAMIAEGQRVVA